MATEHEQGCDLLSIFCIFDTANNFGVVLPSCEEVVICFQFFVSLILLTTFDKYLLFVMRL